MRDVKKASRAKASIKGLAVIVVPWVCLGLPRTAAAQKPAVVRIWNWNIHDKKYQQKMYKLFNQRQPEIKIEYSSISNTVYAQVLEAAFVAKEPPDLFYPSGRYTFNYLLREGLIKPLNDCAPTSADLKAWMSTFPRVLNRYVEGDSLFDGKAYHVDLSGTSNLAYELLFYNKTLFREAGIERLPVTYSELRQSAAKATSAGAGKYFGIISGMSWDEHWHYDVAYTLAKNGGARGVVYGAKWPDLRDGKFHNGSPEFINAFKVWTGMREDGSVFPGVETMEDEQAKMLFATNKAALQFGGWWNIGNYLGYNPDVDFDPLFPPTTEDRIKRIFNQTNRPGSPSGYVVSAGTKNPGAVWEVVRFISSLEYQQGYVQGGFGISFLPEANKRENYTQPQMYDLVEWAMDPSMGRAMPVVSQEAWKVTDYVPGVYPTQEDVRNTVYLGKAGFDAFTDLDNRLNEAFDIGIRKAQEAGVKVTKNDFVFPDWDIMKDYVPKKK